MAKQRAHDVVRLAKAWSADGNVLAIRFRLVRADGTYGPDALEPIVFDRRWCPHLAGDAERHGWEQRLGDAAALSAGATPEEKRAAMAELIKHYNQPGASWERAKRPVRPLTPEEKKALLAKMAAELGATVTF